MTQNAYFTPETIKRLADRHRGIGFDQLLIVEPPYDPDLDSITVFLMQMAVKYRNVETGQDVLRVLSP